MPTRLLSFFGSYDFLAKTLPGIAFVAGIFPLLKHNAVPVPDVSDSILVFITTLAMIGLAGTLLGEVVHSIAHLLEEIAEWGGKLLREIKDRTAYALGIRIPRPSEDSPNKRRPDEDGESNLYTRLRRKGWNLLKEAYSRSFNWGKRRVSEVAYIVWGHRNQFHSKVKSPGPTSFSQQYMIDFVLDELNDPAPHNYDDIYMVVTSFLTNKGCERAFRFQSRYAFCRSMSFVSFFVGVVYILVVEYPPYLPIPTAFDYQPYLLAYFSNSSGVSSIIWMISYILIAISLIFARAAGAYKRYFVEYLISELYVARELMD
ncbi:hypothetical protein ELS19_01130 [Halogeometricum borinquense]|uniref:Uncharacterized protein n=1 Tax=Halogeometricum borinquense TaxID=60847 RepID=A0A482TFR5_9EURY|nr:hypothetical protein [Halogeometricum borinquense]RYJ12713.1 hypothetical protein ELS19_01130 [Halogeometricum borinquense]